MKNTTFTHKILWFIVLAFLGFIGNFLEVPLSYGVAFIFGSIASIVALALLGAGWGVAVSVVSSLYTVILWNHPYALIIFTCEMIWIAVSLRRGKTNIVLVDALFWLVCGWLLVTLFYGGALQMQTQGIIIIFLKQMLNGIFNALIAAIILDHTPLLRMFGFKKSKTSFNRLVFQIICLFLMVPMLLLLLFSSHRYVTDYNREMAARVRIVAKQASIDMAYWLRIHTEAAKAIAELGSRYGIKPSSKLQDELQRISKLFPDFHNVYLADETGTTVAFYPLRNEKGSNNIGLNFSDRLYYKQLKDSKNFVISDVFMARGGVFKPIFSISVSVQRAGRLSHYGLGAVNLDRLVDRFNDHAQQNSMIYTLFDNKKNIVFSTDSTRAPLASQQLSKHELIPSTLPDVFLRIPSAQKNTSVMQAWKGASYITTVPVIGSDWTLEVMYPTAPMQKKLSELTISGLVLVSLLLLALVSVAAALSKHLTEPLEALARLSADVPEKIERSEKLVWPESSIAEVDELVSHFKETSVALASRFDLINRRFALAAKAAGIGVWEWVIADKRVQWDQRMYRLYGMVPDQEYVLFKAWLGSIHPDDRTLLAKALANALRCNGEYAAQFRIYLPSGEIRYIKANAVLLLTADNKPDRLIGINWDVTDQTLSEQAIIAEKEVAESAMQVKSESLALLEQEMAERQKVEDALHNLNATLESRIDDEVRKNRDKDSMLLHQDKLASIGQLAAGVAHEINNPIGFIMSNLNTLKEYTASLQKYLYVFDESGQLSTDQVVQDARKQLDIDYILTDIQPLLTESVEGAERVRRIVLDLKDFARPDEQQMHEADLNKLVQSTINIVRNELKYVAQLDLKLGSIPPIICRSQQINQVISNLLVNAAHAIDQQGTITISTRQEAASVILVVEDTGKGIPPELLSKIYDPFFTTKEVGKGTGLGLSISYDIVQKHGGEITVESEVGVGTSFTVKLPITPTSEMTGV